jgi:hypothetical protein
MKIMDMAISGFFRYLFILNVPDEQRRKIMPDE